MGISGLGGVETPVYGDCNRNPKRDLGTPIYHLCREMRRNFPGNSGFPIKAKRNAKKKADPRKFREIHSGDPEWAFWDDFPWRMRMAKADMLGTGDPLDKKEHPPFPTPIDVVVTSDYTDLPS